MPDIKKINIEQEPFLFLTSTDQPVSTENFLRSFLCTWLKRFLWAFLILISKKSFTQHQTNESAKLILNHAIAELGKGWDTIQALKLEGYGTSFAIDQSERFEGPYIPAQINRSMIVLPAQQIMQVEEQQNDFVFGGNTTYLLNGAAIAVKDKEGIHAGDEYESLQDRLLLSPDVLFRKALASHSLRLQKDTLLQKTVQYVLSFLYENFPRKDLYQQGNFYDHGC